MPGIFVETGVLAASAAAENAGAGSMLAAMGAAAPLTCAVLPPSGDAPGAMAAAGLNARGAATQAMMTELAGMRSLFGDTIGVNGASYAATDAIGSTILSL
jgi:hypothetical protein